MPIADLVARFAVGEPRAERPLRVDADGDLELALHSRRGKRVVPALLLAVLRTLRVLLGGSRGAAGASRHPERRSLSGDCGRRLRRLPDVELREYPDELARFGREPRRRLEGQCVGIRAHRAHLAHGDCRLVHTGVRVRDPDELASGRQ
jgi:hypothetical protein